MSTTCTPDYPTSNLAYRSVATLDENPRGLSTLPPAFSRHVAATGRRAAVTKNQPELRRTAS